MTALSLPYESFQTFGDLLKYLRRRERLTQLELSISVGYSEAQISRLEQNQRLPDLAALKAVFIPSLHLENEPELTARLLHLAQSARQEDAPVAGVPPYKGLLFFDQSDADLFFGRETLTTHLVDRITDLATDASSRFLAIVGASGSGKSSLVRAGLAVTLQRSGWAVHIFTPTTNPLKMLAANYNSTRAKGGKHHLILVDQFEETFTLCRDENERAAFVERLLSIARDKSAKTTVVIALRADFYSHCAQYPLLREAVAAEQEYIGQMTNEELRRAIEEPAKHGGWEFERGLVDLLLNDIGADGTGQPEPGALPLLSHALLATWERRRGRTFTIEGYRASGGVRGAIAETAESVFNDRLNRSQQNLARGIFLRLTELGEGTEDTRRRAGLNELAHQSEEAAQLRAVLNMLADARLITLNEDSAEVAHEALIREWQRLHEWLSQDREGLRLHRHLTESAHEWEARGYDVAELYRGARLAQMREWALSNEEGLNASERGFIAASIEHEEHEELEREAQRQRELESAQKLAETERQRAEEQTRFAKQLGKRAIYLTGAFIIALLMAFTALYFGSQARQTAVTAQSDKRVATARELAAASLNNLNVDPERSILLALQSVSTTRSVDETVLPESLEALHRSIITSQARMTLTGHNSWVLSVDYSPDGSQLASIGYDGTVIVWDASTGEELLRLPGTSEPNDFITTKRVTYSPDGKLLIACDRNQVKFYDPASGTLLKTLIGHEAYITSIVISTDGKLIASGGLDGSVIIWDVSTGGPILQLGGHTDAIEELTFSPDGKLLVTAGDDAAMRIWDVMTGDMLREYIDFNGVVVSVAFSPDGKQLAFSDDSLHVWQFNFETTNDEDTIVNQEIFTIPVAASGSFSPDGKVLAGAGGSETSGVDIKLWDAISGRELLTLAGQRDVMGLAFSPDGKSLASTSSDGTVKIWSLSPGNEKVTVSAPGAGFGTRVVYNPNGQEFVTNGGDGTATVWNVGNGEPLLAVHGHDLEVLNVAFSADGRRFATGSLDGTAIVWNAISGQKLITLPAHEAGVRDVAFSPNGDLIVTGGFDGTAKLWDATTGALIYEITDHQGLVLGVAFNPDGTRFITASTDETAKIWDVKTGKLVFTLSGHTNVLPDVAYSPDGSIIATGSRDGTTMLWDAANGSQTKILIGHSSGVFSVAFSPDGKFLATGSEDNTAKIWDIESGQEILTLPGSEGGVHGVAFSLSDNGTYLAVSSRDGVVRIFLLRIDELLTLAQSRVTRTLTLEECQQYLHMDVCPAAP